MVIIRVRPLGSGPHTLTQFFWEYPPSLPSPVRTPLRKIKPFMELRRTGFFIFYHLCLTNKKVSSTFPNIFPYRVYSRSEHGNRIYIDLLRCEFTFQDEVRQQRYSYNTRGCYLVKTFKSYRKEDIEASAKYKERGVLVPIGDRNDIYILIYIITFHVSCF